MSLLVGSLVLLLLSLAPAGIALVLTYRQLRQRSADQVAVPVRSSLHTPGAHLRQEISRRQFDLSLFIGLLCGTGPYIGLLVLVQAYLAQRALGATDFTVFAISTIGISVLILIKLVDVLGSLKASRYSLECELSVGTELDQLMQMGYRVYHNVPCDGARIDHIAVGRNGIFAIDTIARSSLVAKEETEHRITVDVDRINLPGEYGTVVDTQSIAQLTRHADRIAQWLSDELGEKLIVTPVLVFPGWQIRVYNDADVAVLNEKQIRSELPKLKGQRLADANVARLAYKLESRIRDNHENFTYTPPEVRQVA